MNMNWSNTNYILRTGVLSVLLLLPGLISATCKTDTIINSYKADSLRFIIKDDSIITFRTGDSIFTIIRADSVLPVAPKQVKHSHTPKYNMPEIWDYSLSVRDGIMENTTSGKRIYYLDLSQSILQRKLK